MLRSVLRLTACAMVTSAIAACTQIPPDYSSEFVRVPVGAGPGPDEVRYAVVPEVCLTPDTTNPGWGGPQLGPHMPPGCATNVNLYAMVENKNDIVRGQKLSPAPATPAAVAAEGYINGTNGQFGNGSQRQGPAMKPSSVTTEAPPAAASTH